MGAIAYAVCYGIAQTELAGVEKVAVELAVQTEDMAYTGEMFASGT